MPNITATSALVGGTVDSHSSPMTMEKTMTLVAVCGKSRNARHGNRAADIDPGQEDRLRVSLADDARSERSDDVEEADQGQRDHRVARIDAEIADIGGKVRGDEGDLEAADEEAGDEQHEAPVGDGFRQRPGRRTGGRHAAARLPQLASCRRAAPPAPGSTSIMTLMMISVSDQP